VDPNPRREREKKRCPNPGVKPGSTKGPTQEGPQKGGSRKRTPRATTKRTKSGKNARGNFPPENLGHKKKESPWEFKAPKRGVQGFPQNPDKPSSNLTCIRWWKELAGMPQIQEDKVNLLKMPTGVDVQEYPHIETLV